MSNATSAIILEKRKVLKDGKFSVKLRITYLREQKYFPIGISLTLEEWERTLQSNPRKDAKDLKIYFNEIEKRAISVIKELVPFSFSEFERKFNQKSAIQKDVFVRLQAYEEKLKNENRFNSAGGYHTTFKSIQKFVGKSKLDLTDITPEWLLKYEKWMLQNDNSLTTIGIYIRNLRTIINLAIEDGDLNRDYYPFGKRKYQIPSGQNIKKAITIQEIKKIIDYKPLTKAEEKARDMWIFSYLCNGANITDIAKLQYKNISKTNLTFIRTKTARSTKTNQKNISIVILPEIKEIIKKWGTKPIKPDVFIFGFINNTDTPERCNIKIKQATKTINKYMVRIGIKLEIDIKLTTYSARHSFATVLKRSGAPIEFISESLGHKDKKTTENYLDSFEDHTKLEYQKKLLDF